MSPRNLIRLLAVAVCVCATLTLALQGAAQQDQEKAKEKPKLGYKDTPMLPGGKWHVHDGDRPQPRMITPGTSSTQDASGRPPSDAIVLFDGKDLSKWQNAKTGDPAPWKVGNGYFEVAKGTGN